MVRGSGDEHFSRGGACPAERKPGTSDTAAATCAVIIYFGVDGRLLDSDLLPIEIELFGKNHGERGHGALTHFGFAEDEGDAIIGSDAHPVVQRIRGLLFLILCGGVRGAWNMKGDDERGASGGSSLQKFTAIQNGSSSHDAPRIRMGRETAG